MTMYEKLTDTLKKMIDNAPCELVSLFNNYVNIWADSHYDFHIYYMEEFEDVFACKSPLQIAEWVYTSEDFNPNDDYFNFDTNNELLSFNWLGSKNCNIDIDDLADYIWKTHESLGSNTIQKILDEYQDII